MSEPADTSVTLALNTKLEKDFVAPLTAVRGALEILRDFPDLDARERQQFVETALESCSRLTVGINDLANLGQAITGELEVAFGVKFDDLFT